MRSHVGLLLAGLWSLPSPVIYARPDANVSSLAAARTTLRPGRHVDAVRGRVEILEKGGATKDLDGTIVWLEGDGLGAAQPQRLEIAMGDKTFRPGIVLAPVGSTVSFPNEDDFDHNVFSRSEAKPFDLGLYGRGIAKGVTLERPGLLNVYCNVHARMAAVVLAHASPFASRADATGRFQFDNVPTGRYTLRAWHERGGDQSLQLTVPGPDSLVVVRLDARSYRFVQHLDKTGKRYDTRGRRY